MNHLDKNITSKYVFLKNGDLALCMRGEGCVNSHGESTIVIFDPKINKEREINENEIERVASSMEKDTALSKIFHDKDSNIIIS